MSYNNQQSYSMFSQMNILVQILKKFFALEISAKLYLMSVILIGVILKLEFFHRIRKLS